MYSKLQYEEVAESKEVVVLAQQCNKGWGVKAGMVKRPREEGTGNNNNNNQKRGREIDQGACDTLEMVASRCRDNITGGLLVDPVVAEDGHTYERRAIKEWFRRRTPATSPLTHEEIGTRVKENYAIRAIVEDLVSSPGLPRFERAEWYLARGKLLCERSRAETSSLAPELLPSSGSSSPDIRSARNAFERAERLVDSDNGVDDPSAKRLREEAQICREMCDRVLDVSRLRRQASEAGIDVNWVDDAYDAIFRPVGVKLTMFQKLARGTRVRVLDDRRAVLAAFEAQDDVLGLPDDWEESLGREFIVENYDANDSTYVIVRPDTFDEHEDNSKEGKWWPFSLVALLPS
ncbi:hypothetical protein CTAYLR_005435 [Chrysophaeum taylorii]|uniref:U-box domain-containing protein n=1 Tax=Chrysophaeum taylorii TaxID=2483200 RepID=A0AAD7UKX9_9STRA|nr:hypothetical protein CTAYLR_005435 [Chrysophaeum taylorii]